MSRRTTRLKPKATVRDSAGAIADAAPAHHGANSEPARADVEAWKDVGIDLDAVTATGPKLPIAGDFQPPAAAAEVPLLDGSRPPRRRRAGK